MIVNTYFSNQTNSTLLFSNCKTSSGSTKSNTKKTKSFTIQKKISATDYMRRIHDAKTPSAVNNIINAARSDAKFVKSSGASEADVRLALRIVAKTVSKGKVKMAKLRREKQIELLKETAKHKEKMKLQKDLIRKQRVRAAIERADELDFREVNITKKIIMEEETNERDQTSYDSTNSTPNTIDSTSTMTSLDITI